LLAASLRLRQARQFRVARVGNFYSSAIESAAVGAAQGYIYKYLIYKVKILLHGLTLNIGNHIYRIRDKYLTM
jgi:hypothetical protein